MSRDAMADALEPHVPAMRRYARALLRDRDEADDLVQDALERAVGRWHFRRRDGNTRAWLFAILHNRFVDTLRRRRREGFRVDLDDALDLPGPSHAAPGRLQLGDALAALDRLPAEGRAVLLLVGVEDLTYEEAASVLGVPVGTVMSRLNRARERLRRVMDGPSGAATPTLRRVK